MAGIASKVKSEKVRKMKKALLPITILLFIFISVAEPNNSPRPELQSLRTEITKLKLSIKSLRKTIEKLKKDLEKEEEENNRLLNLCKKVGINICLLYTSPSPRDRS